MCIIHTYYVLTNPPIPSSPCNNIVILRPKFVSITRELAQEFNLVNYFIFPPSLYIGIFEKSIFFIFFDVMINLANWYVCMYIYTYRDIYILHVTYLCVPVCMCVCICLYIQLPWHGQRIHRRHRRGDTTPPTNSYPEFVPSRTCSPATDQSPVSFFFRVRAK